MHIEYRYSFTIITGNCGLHVYEPYQGTKGFLGFCFDLLFLNIFNAGLTQSIDVELAEVVIPSSCCILRSYNITKNYLQPAHAMISFYIMFLFM